MTVLLGTSQITWLQHLYDRQLKNQHATPIPSDIFSTVRISRIAAPVGEVILGGGGAHNPGRIVGGCRMAA